MDFGGVVVFGLVGVADDSGDHWRFGGGAGDHDDASFWFELVEDEGHDGVEEFAFVGDSGGDGGEGVDDAEMVFGGGGGVDGVADVGVS